MAVKAQPDGYSTLTPYLIVKGAGDAIEFYKKAFGAREVMRIDGPNGSIGHAELIVGDSKFMLADEFPDMGARGPKSIGGSPVGLHLYVDDVDAVATRAIAEGLKVVRPVADQFYGDRLGLFEDPFGHSWSLATHVEEVTPEEMQRRAATMGKE